MTIKEFASEIGVSPATVSRALNGHRDVSDDTRRLVQRRMVELGYQPNRAASALSSRRSGLVAIWSGNQLSAYHMKVIDGLRREAARDQCQVLIDYDPAEADGPQPELAPGWPLDGVVVMGTHNFERRSGRVPGELPVVAVDDHMLPEVDTVGPNLLAGAREALSHLRDVGCRRIALLAPQWIVPETDSRWAAYHDAMREFGSRPLVLMADTNTSEAARDGLLRGLARHPQPDGLFCFNDLMALGALSALHDTGLRVPEDVAVVGCDGLDETACWHPSLTTIALPYSELAALAWQCLRRRLDEPKAPPRQMLLQTALVVRDSSRRQRADS